jgi:uncharacterized protein
VVETAIVLAVTFLLAGTVKGVVGMGFPAVSLAVLTLSFGLEEAMALMIVPALLTNIMQAVTGGALRVLLKRLWPLLVMILAGVWIGTWGLALSDADLLAALLGVLILGYGIYGLAMPQLPELVRFERPVSALVGLLNGVITGLVGTFFMPAVPYLQTLRLKRDDMVQAMGLVFMTSTAGLGLSLSGFGMMTGSTAAWSLAGTVPAILGMVAGRRIRRRLDENRFRQILLVTLMVLGAAIAVRALT